MEFWTSHDLNGDGKPDLFIRHTPPNRPSEGDAVLGCFLLIFFGVNIGSFTFFGVCASLFGDKRGELFLPIGVIACLTSVGLALVYCGDLAKGRCGPLLLAIGIYLASGFCILLMMHMARENALVAHEQHEAAVRQGFKTAFRKIEDRGNSVIRHAKNYLQEQDWNIKKVDVRRSLPTKGEWRSPSEITSGDGTAFIIAESPLFEVTVELEYSMKNALLEVRAYGPDSHKLLSTGHREAEVRVRRAAGHEWTWTSLSRVRASTCNPGRFHDILMNLEQVMGKGNTEYDNFEQSISEKNGNAGASTPSTGNTHFWRWLIGIGVTGSLCVVARFYWYRRRDRRPQTSCPLGSMDGVRTPSQVTRNRRQSLDSSILASSATEGQPEVTIAPREVRIRCKHCKLKFIVFASPHEKSICCAACLSDCQIDP